MKTEVRLIFALYSRFPRTTRDIGLWLRSELVKQSDELERLCRINPEQPLDEWETDMMEKVDASIRGDGNRDEAPKPGSEEWHEEFRAGLVDDIKMSEAHYYQLIRTIAALHSGKFSTASEYFEMRLSNLENICGRITEEMPHLMQMLSKERLKRLEEFSVQLKNFHERLQFLSKKAGA